MPNRHRGTQTNACALPHSGLEHCPRFVAASPRPVSRSRISSPAICSCRTPRRLESGPWPVGRSWSKIRWARAPTGMLSNSGTMKRQNESTLSYFKIISSPELWKAALIYFFPFAINFPLKWMLSASVFKSWLWYVGREIHVSSVLCSWPRKHVCNSFIEDLASNRTKEENKTAVKELLQCQFLKYALIRSSEEDICFLCLNKLESQPDLVPILWPWGNLCDLLALNHPVCKLQI